MSTEPKHSLPCPGCEHVKAGSEGAERMPHTCTEPKPNPVPRRAMTPEPQKWLILIEVERYPEDPFPGQLDWEEYLTERLMNELPAESVRCNSYIVKHGALDDGHAAKGLRPWKCACNPCPHPDGYCNVSRKVRQQHPTCFHYSGECVGRLDPGRSLYESLTRIGEIFGQAD